MSSVFIIKLTELFINNAFQYFSNLSKKKLTEIISIYGINCTFSCSSWSTMHVVRGHTLKK